MLPLSPGIWQMRWFEPSCRVRAARAPEALPAYPVRRARRQAATLDPTLVPVARQVACLPACHLRFVSNSALWRPLLR